MLYTAYELSHAAVRPYRNIATATRQFLQSTQNPYAEWPANRALAAACEVFESVTKRYGKPAFEINEVVIGKNVVPINEKFVMDHPFGRLLHFERDAAALPSNQKNAPKVLLVAPMSGHYATLLRGTVRAMLHEHDVFITDWIDAREVPLSEGYFNLDDYIGYLIEYCQKLGPNLHVLAVCQPGPAALAATAIMSAANDPNVPASLTLMGSP
ncbi:MAG: polyhydroxyalkanoate depolymerase, partial [Rhodospirillales bacterium]